MKSRRLPALVVLALLPLACAAWARAESLGDGDGDVSPAGLARPSTAFSDCAPSGRGTSFPSGFTASMCFEYEKDGETVRADALDYGLGSGKSGLFYFFGRDNAELPIKVLDGCAINGRHEHPAVMATASAGRPRRRAISPRFPAATRPERTQGTIRAGPVPGGPVKPWTYRARITGYRGDPSRWLLTPRHLEGDIELTRRGGETTVRISEAVFADSERRVAKVEGKRGVWFSKRLHHAMVRYVTNNGRDEDTYERIFKERFGLTTVVDDYLALTRDITDEDESRFQKFHPREIVALLNAFEEFPSGMHKTPGLGVLVRRLDGLPHPLYPEAGAVAWTDAGYVEFMERGLRQGIDGMQRLIVHEKAHFLWEHVFDDVTKEHWIEIGGWYRIGPGYADWRTTKQTEFVSAYAHSKDPNEDMAETISYFVFNPDKLRSRSVARYEFVRDRITQGNFYVSRVRQDLTFTVYNLYPDYVFPGKCPASTSGSRAPPTRTSGSSSRWSSTRRTACSRAPPAPAPASSATRAPSSISVSIPWTNPGGGPTWAPFSAASTRWTFPPRRGTGRRRG